MFNTNSISTRKNFSHVAPFSGVICDFWVNCCEFVFFYYLKLIVWGRLENFIFYSLNLSQKCSRKLFGQEISKIIPFKTNMKDKIQHECLKST